MQRLLGDIITAAVRATPDMEIVGSVDDLNELATASDELHPDVVLVGLDETGFPVQCVQWLNGHVGGRLIAVNPDGGQLAELRAPGGGISLASLVGTLRRPECSD